MGNGIVYRMLIDCCNNNKEEKFHQGDVDINKNNSNTKIMDLLNRDSIAHKNDQNILKTKSINSSKSGSINKSKIEEREKFGKSPIKPVKSFNLQNFHEFNVNKKEISRNIKSFDNMNFNKNLLKHYNEVDDRKLILSGKLFYNKIIEIDKSGMKNGLRKKKDKTTIFGVKNDIENCDYNIDLCDFYINFPKIKENGKIFLIYFDKMKNNYILYFLHNSLILYYKINDNVCLDIDRYYFIILGEIFLTINVEKINQDENQINLQLEIENEKSRNYTFKQTEMPIKIGRSNCTINISKYSISKTHCFIFWRDGNFYYKDAESTNGSSLLLRKDDYIIIKGEMIFKLEDCSFKIKEISKVDKN